LLSVPPGADAQAREERPQMSEREAAAALRDIRLTPARDRALRLARELGADASQELRAALIDAAWAEWRGETGRPAGSEAAFDYMDAVFRLRDRRAIPFLIEVLIGGGENALADLGAAAFPATLAAVSDPGGHPSRTAHGLTVLRFMVEDGSLNGRQLEQVRETALERLSGSQHSGVVKTAVRLALALGDPELRRTVERIATDRAVAEAVVLDAFPLIAGSHDEDTNSVQERARLFLSGGGADIGPFRKRHSPSVGTTDER
jgi:hypothetical protein